MKDFQGRIQDFRVGGGADPGGAPTYDFVKFSQKLDEIEKILGCRGREVRASPLDPPVTFDRVNNVNSLLSKKADKKLTSLRITQWLPP